MGLLDRDWFNERKPNKPKEPAKRQAERQKAARSETFWPGVAMAVIAVGIALYRLL